MESWPEKKKKHTRPTSVDNEFWALRCPGRHGWHAGENHWRRCPWGWRKTIGLSLLPGRKALTIKKNLYLRKNTQKSGFVVLSGVIFRLIFPLKIFNYQFFFPCHSSWILLPPPFFWLIKLSSCLLLQLLPNSCYCWVLKQRKTLVTKICCILKYKTNKIEPNWPGWGVNYLNLQNQGLRFWIILSG